MAMGRSGFSVRNLRRRIEALEKSRLGRRDDVRSIARKAMVWLWPDDIELLIAAFGADQSGRPLTECEAAARQGYSEALEQEYRWAGLPSTTGSGLTVDLHQAATCVLAFRLSHEELELCLTGVSTAHEGRAPNEREAAAMRAYIAETERLSLLAGFGSVAEFEAFLRQTDFSEERDRC
jgi:hypothetical protein